MSKVFTQVMTDIQREEMAIILKRRDRIVNIADKEIRKADGQFKQTAPKNTGQLRASVVLYRKSRNYRTLKIPSGAGQRANLVNILNNSRKRQRKSAGFWDHIKLGTQNRFINRAKSVK